MFSLEGGTADAETSCEVVSYKEGWPDTIEWFRTALILKGAL